MDSSRLKNIAILILLALNLSFLLIIGLNRYEAGRADQEEKQELAELFGSAGIAVRPEDLPDREAPPTYLLERDAEGEKNLVAALLGETESTDQGGNIFSYENERGSAIFRGNGEFELHLLALDSSEGVEKTARSLLKTMGIEVIGAAAVDLMDDGERSVSFSTVWEGRELLNASVRLSLFSDGSAVLSGRRVNGSVLRDPDSTGVGSATMLLAFLDLLRSGGLVCNRIERVELCYILTASSAGNGLSPVWRIVTDGGEYRLDGVSCELL